MLKTHDRYSYSPIVGRPSYVWPNGAKLAFYVAVNLEVYSFDGGLVEDLVPGGSRPDVLNASWREYGTRVGAWRLLDLLEQLGMPATVLLNSELCHRAPELVAACRARGHEIAAHGRTNSESLAGLDEAAERAILTEVRDTMARAAGEPPAGWLGPWLAETERTPDLLFETGYRYVLDWCADDQPFWLSVRGGRLLSIPYSQEINDSVAIIGRLASAETFADMIIDQVDEMVAQSSDTPLVFGLAVHANIMGQPFRIRQLRRALQHVAGLSQTVWVTRATDIASHIFDTPERAV